MSHYCDNLLCIFMQMEQHTGCCCNILAGDWGMNKLYPHLGIASASGIVWGNFVARVSGKNSTSNPAMSDRVPASNAPPTWVGNWNKCGLFTMKSTNQTAISVLCYFLKSMPTIRNRCNKINRQHSVGWFYYNLLLCYCVYKIKRYQPHTNKQASRCIANHDHFVQFMRCVLCGTFHILYNEDNRNICISNKIFIH